jgi:hypothetical protein
MCSVSLQFKPLTQASRSPVLLTISSTALALLWPINVGQPTRVLPLQSPPIHNLPIAQVQPFTENPL